MQLDLESETGTTSVIVGETGVGGGEQAYVRRDGEATSWLVSGSFDLARETADWLDRSLTDIAAERVHAVTITHPGGATVRVVKETPGAGDFAVENVPRGRELSFPGVGNSIAAALSDLTLENVEPAAEFDPGKVEPTVARFETFDGLVVSASTYGLPSGSRVRFTASADPALAARFAPPATPAGAGAAPSPEAPAENAPKSDTAPAEAPPERTADPAAGTAASGQPATPEASRKSLDEAQAEAKQLEARLGGWVYTLPDFKAEQLTKKLGDLLQPRSAQN
jgi:hypothetical protein